MKYITTRVSRENIGSKGSDFDGIVVAESNTPEEISEKEYYAPAIRLLALIMAEYADASVN